jgi:hypothetical protein
MKSGSRGRAEVVVPSTIGSSASSKGRPSGGRHKGERRSDAGTQTLKQAAWPWWARLLVSLALLFHMIAVVAGALGVPPSSRLERTIADPFAPYYDLADLGYSYRYYTEPPPTPVITATLSFGDGRPEETLRLPGRDVAGPRLRHQRQLALANALFNDVREVKEHTGESSRSLLARAYARHLCRTRPDCRSVTLHLRQHLIPDPDRVREAMAAPGAPRFDLFAEELFTTPEWIGDFPCDGF